VAQRQVDFLAHQQTAAFPALPVAILQVF